MTVLNEGTYIGDIVKYEADDRYSRDVVTIKDGEGALAKGTVLAKNGDEYVIVAPAATDGTEVAVAVLLQDVDTTDAAASAVVLSRHAKVETSKLIFPDGISAPDKATALGQLAAVGIIAAEGA